MALVIRNTKEDKPRFLRIGIYGDTGVGKAQPAYIPVVTPTGFRPIGALVAGDAVIDSRGLPTRVEAVFPQGEKVICKVTFSDGVTTRCCWEHLWTVNTKVRVHRGQPPRTYMLHQLAERLHDGGGGRCYYIPPSPVVHYEEQPPLPIDAYLLGLLIGDGSLTKSPPAFCKGEPDLLERVRLAVAPFGLHVDDRAADSCTWSIVTGLRGGSTTNPLTNILRGLGLMGTKSVNKFIPPVYLLSAPSDRLALLRGLIDTDGDVNKHGTVTFNTSSEQLKNDVVTLVQSLGGVAKWHSRLPTYQYAGEERIGHRAYRVNIALPIGARPVSSVKHLRYWKERSKYPPSRAIDRIEEDGSADCVCIKVAAPDGLYLTNDFIVTHNTWCAASFPRPFFFSVGAEAGVSSLTAAKGDGVDYALIETKRDMDDAVQMFKKDYKKRDWRTAVVDTASVYGRFVSMEESHHGDIQMEQSKWMKVLGHLLNIRDVLHTCEVHVVWVFHAEDRKSGDFVLQREPKLVGQARGEIIQTLGLLCYLTREDIAAKTNEEGVVVAKAETIRRLWVRCPVDMKPQFMFKNWYETVLNDPRCCYEPYFSVLAKHLAPTHIQSLLDEPGGNGRKKAEKAEKQEKEDDKKSGFEPRK